MHDDTPHTTFSEIFDLWTRTTDLARDMGVKKTTADQWKRRRFCEPCYWPQLIELARTKFGRTVTADELVLAAARVRPARSLQDAEGAGADATARQPTERAI